jgi:tRNA/rRNA methyltransferase
MTAGEAKQSVEIQDTSAGRCPGIHGTALAVANVVHACHERSVDEGLAQLSVPGLDRTSLERVLTYCAELRCEADNATCPGCKRRTEAQGLHTLDDFIRSHAEIVVGDGQVRLVGQGTDTIRTPALAAL